MWINFFVNFGKIFKVKDSWADKTETMNYKKNIVIGVTIFTIVVLIEISTYYISLGNKIDEDYPAMNFCVWISGALRRGF